MNPCLHLSYDCAIAVAYETVTCFSLSQSKDIGVQMHEELVKVTNELYTVSKNKYHCPFMLNLSLPTPACLFCLSLRVSCLWLVNPEPELFFRPEPLTCEAAGLTLHTADMPYQQCTL